MIEIQIKWVIAILMTAAWFVWCWIETKDDYGYIQGLGMIFPTFLYLIAWVVWLIIF